jgi:hypothetical protein
VRYMWVANSQYTETLYKQHPDEKRPQKMAWVSCVFATDTRPQRWRAQIVSTGNPCYTETLQQAKDWAQAVILLTQ